MSSVYEYEYIIRLCNSKIYSKYSLTQSNHKLIGELRVSVQQSLTMRPSVGMAGLSKSSVGMKCGWSASPVASEANVLSESDGIISVLNASLTLDRGPRLTMRTVHAIQASNAN